MHFGLKGNKDGLPDTAEIEKPICCLCYKTVSEKRSNTEKQGFKKMVSMFDPKYSLPSRNFAEKQIPKLYNELRDTVVKPAVIRANCYTVTTDLWTSCARHPFMSFTMYFIDDNWQLKTFCLSTVPHGRIQGRVFGVWRPPSSLCLILK